MVKLFSKAGVVIGLGLLIVNCSIDGPIQYTAEKGIVTQASVSKALMCKPPVNTKVPAMAASLQFPGRLEIVRRLQSNTGLLEHLYWEPGSGTWTQQETFASGVSSDPSLCVRRADNLLQVVTIDNNYYGALHHYWRSSTGTWVDQATYGSNLFGSPAMICNNQTPYNLEVIARDGNNKYMHLYRDQDQAWHVTGYLPMNSGQTAYGDPSFAQTPNGTFHVVANVYNSSTGQYYRVYWTRSFVNGQYVWNIVQSDGYLNQAVRPAIVGLNDNTVEVFYKSAGSLKRCIEFLKTTPTNPLLTWDDYICVTSSDDGLLSMEPFGAATLNDNEMHLAFYTRYGRNISQNQHFRLLRQ